MNRQASNPADNMADWLAAIEASIGASTSEATLPLAADTAGQALALAGAALQRGLANAHQTARSMASFLDNLRDRSLNEQDRLQLQLLLDNLRHELGENEAAAPFAPALVAAIAPSRRTENDRIALYVESRAITAMLSEMLHQAGFSPRPLASMQALATASERDYPAAIVADLALCLRDPDTREAITALRERFSPPPHLFALASGDDTAARLQAVRLGATRFLKKPVDTEKLLAILRGVTMRTSTETFRALFVDDDRIMAAVYVAAMKNIGVEVRTVNDPLQAPVAVAEFAPDVIVTDVYMPGCNGLELAALLRQDESIADTPILFLSSETNIKRQMAALDLGGDDFLTKPVNIEVLQSAVIARVKRARMLKRSRREYLAVAEHLKRIELAINEHSIVSIADAEGYIVYVNPRFCEVSGYSVGELLGANHRIVNSGSHPPEFYRKMWETIGSGRTWHDEVCNRRKDGSLYWVNPTITPQLDEHGRPVRYISVHSDITPLKELQAQLMEAEADAEAASQAKTIFLAHMSHELKTPLNGILGFAELLESDPELADDPDRKEMLNGIGNAGRHLLELINDLVDLAQVETGHIGFALQDVALPALLRECFALVKPQAQKRGIVIEADCGNEEEAWVHADTIRLKQVLLNLLSNAVKYNRDKGSVKVICRREGAVCRVGVHDSGPGISQQDQDSLFQPFLRLRDTAQAVEGTGIGLSLSRSLVERMEGRIGVISTPGAGSEFWFELPAAKPAADVSAL